MASGIELVDEESPPSTGVDGDATDDDLPQCKIKRNYSCNLCPFFSQNPRSFLYHTRDVHHDRIKIYECSQCLYASKHSQKLQRHINMIHVPGRFTEKKEPPKNRSLKPKPTPSASADVESELIEPVEVLEDDNERKVKCSLCSFTSRSMALIFKHERIVHLKKRFLRCSKCSYVTHVKARFTKHVKYHSMPMIKCDLCDFRTPYKWNLDRHYKNHCGTGAFQCSKCNFRADIKQSLTVHEMNHHVPPVGAGAMILMRKKNKVGASETTALESDAIDQEEMELLRLERDQDSENPANYLDFKMAESDDEEPDLNADLPGKLETALVGGTSSANANFAHPSSATYKPLKCKACSYRASFAHELTRHERKAHGQRDKRPPPNLIPIQGKSSSPILKIPEISKRILTDESTPPVNEEEFNEMCKRSSLTSSLKQFVSLIGDEEALKNIPDPSEDADKPVDSKDKEISLTEILRNKNASFFDKIKEKLVSNGNDDDLVCQECGYVCSSLSESLSHKKKHKNENSVSGIELSSTRCQHCRHRCKTSADLVTHLKGCKAYIAACANQDEEDEDGEDDEDDMNRNFVWTQYQGHNMDDGGSYDDLENEDMDDHPDFPMAVLETHLEIPDSEMGTEEKEFGVLPRTTLTTTAKLQFSPPKESKGSMKKVFKCPHCSFWASTASRFHVHIVGHLNKKPFECSLCCYRSNWRWDITKHIRLKSARDPKHAQATVNMTDETGRRNYSKYNKYLTMMKVHEPTADSSGTGRRTRACDATQGTVREGDILQPIPELPKLTPAPAVASSSSLNRPGPLRPPPPLQAAHNSGPGKKTLWKCKKCQYRNSDKENVIAHVKGHYDSPTDKCLPEAYSPSIAFTDEADMDMDNAENEQSPKLYKCGNCKRTSTSRQTIQRHCMQKHSGNIVILPATEQDANLPALEDSETEEASQPRFPHACDICPFSAETEGNLTAHKLNHVDRPGSIFKCTFCPFFVPSKIAVLEHMTVHGVEKSDNAKMNVDNFDPSECTVLPPAEGDPDAIKRYRCRQCPYITHCKTQFLYHKQFHRPRDAPFKCMYCSYNVSRRHLLHQHLRVHHLKRSSTDGELSDIPLVWVLRGKTYLKMFKCRFCPHVNARRVNIQEHERMHRGNNSSKLQCSDCNYTCNSPGVLSAHAKVHSGCFGEIQSVVDPNRSDQEQIETLQNTMAEPEIVIKEEDMDPDQNTPESCYYQSNQEQNDKEDTEKSLSFCHKCPARFLFKKELRIHSKFHLIRLPFKCNYCSYTARQRPHLLAHYKVHGLEYQEKTAALVEIHLVSSEYPQPQIKLICSSSEFVEGTVWTVVPQAKSNSFRGEHKVPSKPLAKHACHKCPAKFFKPVALQYHLTLHGGTHQHHCKYCDYSVKTYGNLVKHQLVHETEQQHVERPKTPEKKVDPQFGSLMHGSPNFIYPTYLKNGKLKEKRYKCHKCPSAFEKRDQYRVHLSLHGSKQKYKCEKCDYSVKYYANYIQHMKKHKDDENAHLALVDKEDVVEESVPLPIERPMSQIEKQMLILAERKRKNKDIDKKLFICDLCPYFNFRRDCLENHERRHKIISGKSNEFNCKHCDYSTTQSNFLRAHTLAHFQPYARFQPEAFLLVDHFELLYGEGEDEEGDLNQLFDQEDEAILPEEWENDDDDGKIYFDPAVGEPVLEPEDMQPDDLIAEDLDIEMDISSLSPVEAGEAEDDLIEMVEETVYVKQRPKRRRGKNLICTKCPHAFGKRDQYQRHISLHGSNQRYSCDICDYSVKYYTNYVQHMRMHQSYEPERHVEIKQYVAQSESEPEIEVETEIDCMQIDGDESSFGSDSFSSVLVSKLTETTVNDSEMQVT